MELIDFGLSDYRQIWEKQKRLHRELIEAKRNGDFGEEYLLIGEHTPVYTLGFHGDQSNLLVSESTLNQKNCEVIRIERGGDITFHGPGQLIVYPIIDLERYRLGVKSYITILEESVIQLLARYGIRGRRIEGATGVWIDKNTPGERKICAIGVKVSRFVTMHGLALNVNTDLNSFNAINPCGFTDKGVTSIEKEIGEKVDISKVKTEFIDNFLQILANSFVL